jgi:30S ribosomal protein S31
MGKGDKRTRRGKIFAGSYGKTRQKPHTAAFVASEKPAVEKAPKKRTPKVVKSAPAPEPVSEHVDVVSGSAGTEGVSATPETAPDTTKAPAAEAPEASPAAEEKPHEPAPAEESSNDAPA